MKTPVSLAKEPCKNAFVFQIIPDILAATMCSPQMITSLLRKQMLQKLNLHKMLYFLLK